MFRLGCTEFPHLEILDMVDRGVCLERLETSSYRCLPWIRPSHSGVAFSILFRQGLGIGRHRTLICLRKELHWSCNLQDLQVKGVFRFLSFLCQRSHLLWSLALLLVYWFTSSTSLQEKGSLFEESDHCLGFGCDLHVLSCSRVKTDPGFRKSSRISWQISVKLFYESRLMSLSSKDCMFISLEGLFREYVLYDYWRTWKEKACIQVWEGLVFKIMVERLVDLGGAWLCTHHNINLNHSSCTWVAPVPPRGTAFIVTESVQMYTAT